MAPKRSHRLHRPNTRKHTKKDLVMCIQPDPVCSFERYGVDFDDLAKYADAFNVVMFSKNYATPWYWEMLSTSIQKAARRKPILHKPVRFRSRRHPADVPTASELLTVSARIARAGVDGILYLTEKAKPNPRLPKSSSRTKLNSEND